MTAENQQPARNRRENPYRLNPNENFYRPTGYQSTVAKSPFRTPVIKVDISPTGQPIADPNSVRSGVATD